ncbi:hypothetical protein ALC56_14212 [Trachymyrmex septentrionalis]|uniref:Uncharacterized protein n=1 Tax=Trachymyrmex septentrionalis TaxID=34720 RepID=A0A195ET46_9HYME|nr:hypothetical protein ALC56_14212 [Trachymyrmex septentrionalis]
MFAATNDASKSSKGNSSVSANLRLRRELMSRTVHGVYDFCRRVLIVVPRCTAFTSLEFLVSAVSLIIFCRSPDLEKEAEVADQTETDASEKHPLSSVIMVTHDGDDVPGRTRFKSGRNRVKRTRTSKGEKTARGRESYLLPVARSVSTPLSGIAVLDSRNHSATVATKLQTISSSHRSSRKSLVGRTSMNQRGLLSIGRIWSSLDLPRSADREYDGREIGRTLFVSFRSGGEDTEWKGMRNKIKRGKGTGRERERERERVMLVRWPLKN